MYHVRTIVRIHLWHLSVFQAGPVRPSRWRQPSGVNMSHAAKYRKKMYTFSTDLNDMRHVFISSIFTFFFSLFGCVSACVWRGNYVLATDWLSTDERWTEILTDWHYLPTLFTVRENQKYTFSFDVYEVYLRPANKAGHLKSQREK